MKQTNLSIYCLTFIFFGLFLLWGHPASALSDEEFETRFQKLSNELRCPTCQGLSVKDSDAGFSVQMKNKVKELLKAGQSDEEIKDYFVERYGEWILRSPSKKGLNLLLWILPGLGIILGLIVVFRKSQQWVKKNAVESKEAAPSISAEEEKLIAEDLKRFEQSV